MIDQVFWPVPPGNTRPNRPRELYAALSEIGVLGQAELFHHGRVGSQDGSTHHRDLQASASGARRAVLSPLFPLAITRTARWVDFYDDWSIAPDVHRVKRLVAARNYRSLRRSRVGESPLITVNTQYMAAKLQLGERNIVPNAVQAQLGSLVCSGDEMKRLIVMGNFFHGRTDFKVFHRLATIGGFEQLVIGAPGTAPEVRKICEEAEQAGVEVEVVEWLSVEGLAARTGPRTAALIPHVVTDYTLSQDLMKAYLFQALGLRVICPLQLWPFSLPKTHAYLYGPGSLEGNSVQEWLAEESPTSSWRQTFADAHSWQARARRVRALLEEFAS